MGSQGLDCHYALQFTCTVCETKMLRKFTKSSYHHGLVIIRCDGCKNNHLIADNYGWFRDTPTTIEDIMREKGEEIKKLKAEGLFTFSTETYVTDSQTTSDENIKNKL